MKTFEKAFRKHLQEVEALKHENSYLKNDLYELRAITVQHKVSIDMLVKERDELKQACNALEFALDATQESLKKATLDVESIRKFREESLEAMNIGLANAKKEIQAKDREIARLKIPAEVKTCEAIQNLETELEKTRMELANAKEEIAKFRIPYSVGTAEDNPSLEMELEIIRKQILSEIERREALEKIGVTYDPLQKEVLKANPCVEIEQKLRAEQARSRRLVWIMRKETEQHRRLLDILSATGCYGNAKLETIKGIISSLEMQKDEELGD